MRAPILAGLAIVTVLTMLLWPDATPDAPRLDGERTPRADMATTSSGSLPRDEEPTVADPADADQTERATIAAESVPDLESWTIQFTGIDPAVPFTRPVRFVFHNRLTPPIALDERGVARFVPPPVARGVGIQTFRLVTADDNYRAAVQRPLTLPLQRTGHTEFPVRKIARLKGRVLDPSGNGTVARLTVFAIGADGPHDPPLERSTSLQDGTYVLRVPPALPVLIVAEGAEAATKSTFGREFLPSAPALDEDDPDERDEGPSTLRGEWSPAAARALGVHGTEHEVPDLQLRATSMLTGRACFADGSPFAGATIVARPETSATAAFGRDLHWSPAGNLLRGATTRTEANGTFTLALAPGVPFTVTATSSNPLLLAGEPSATATAGTVLELQVPGDLITVRVRDAGAVVAKAEVDLDGFVAHTDAEGELRITVPTRTVRLHARHEALTSAVVELASGARPAVVSLELERVRLAPVRILLRGRPMPDHATFTFRPLEGGAPIALRRTREGGEMPFVMHVPAGRYRLRCVGTTMPFDMQSIAVEQEVLVPETGFDAAFDIVYGGTIALDVNGQNGVRPRGRFVVRDATGREVPLRAVVHGDGHETVGEIGELLPHGQNHLSDMLPVGRYEIIVENEDGKRAHASVDVRALTRSVVELQPR